MEGGTPGPRRVLYRCRTPTNYLCPCGAVARKLKKRDLEFETGARRSGARTAPRSPS